MKELLKNAVVNFKIEDDGKDKSVSIHINLFTFNE
jgi:hypothetical protein